MKRLASLITAFALALQASGSAFAAANRLIETHYSTGTTEWLYDQDGQVNKVISPQGTILYVYRPNNGRLQEEIKIAAGWTKLFWGFSKGLPGTPWGGYQWREG